LSNTKKEKEIYKKSNNKVFYQTMFNLNSNSYYISWNKELIKWVSL